MSVNLSCSDKSALILPRGLHISVLPRYVKHRTPLRLLPCSVSQNTCVSFRFFPLSKSPRYLPNFSPSLHFLEEETERMIAKKIEHDICTTSSISDLFLTHSKSGKKTRASQGFLSSCQKRGEEKCFAISRPEQCQYFVRARCQSSYCFAARSVRCSRFRVSGLGSEN